MEDQEHPEQTPEEENDVEAHKNKNDVEAHNVRPKNKNAPEAARNDEGDDVEAHVAAKFKPKTKY